MSPREVEGPRSDVRRSVRPERGGASDDSEASEAEPLLDCTGVVETAIAAALKLAAEAQQWDVVVVLAQELHARRVSPMGEGVPRPPAASEETLSHSRKSGPR